MFFQSQPSPTDTMSDETNELLPSTTTMANERRSDRTKVWTGIVIASALGIGVASGVWMFHGSRSESESTGEHDRTITLQLEGKNKSTNKKSHSYENYELACDDGKYSKRTLKLAYELPFASLFQDHKGQRKYEASSVVVVGGDAYAVCDSSWAISKFGKQLQPFADGNVQIGEVHREKEDSGFEALFFDNNTFYAVRESIKHEDKTYHAVIEELEIRGLTYEIKDQCSAEFEFEGDSKGFEGAIAIRDLKNEMVVLGLCEGNHCSEMKKEDRGNGLVVAMRKESHTKLDGSKSCQWKTIRTINVPSSAMFKDYSALSMTYSGKVGISSQEESQFWVGQLLGQNPSSGLWDIDALEFDSEHGSVYDFPKNDSCETVYCNIEGVHWINDDMIMAVSDKMKGRGKQDFICFDKDQSVHVFLLPE